MPGALIGPTGKKPEVLTEREHERLTECLRAIRANANLNELLKDLFTLQADDGDTERFPPEIISHLAGRYLEEYGDYPDEEGVLMRCFGETGVWHLTTTELQFLTHLLQLKRAGGWFPSWLEVHLLRLMEAKTPAQRFPTPAEIMGSFALELEEYSCHSETAQTFAQQRPDLLFPAPRAEPEAAPEPTPITTAAKPQRARKARRKAA